MHLISFLAATFGAVAVVRASSSRLCQLGSKRTHAQWQGPDSSSSSSEIEAAEDLSRREISAIMMVFEAAFGTLKDSLIGTMVLERDPLIANAGVVKAQALEKELRNPTDPEATTEGLVEKFNQGKRDDLRPIGPKRHVD